MLFNIAIAPRSTPVSLLLNQLPYSKKSIMKAVFSDASHNQAKRSRAIASHDSMKSYLKEIGRIPLLSASDEITLGQQVRDMMALLEIKTSLTKELGHDPTEAEWAKAAQLELTELKQVLSKGQRAKRRMVEANLRLVVSVAKKYQRRNLDLLDLIQEGSIGLERAVEKFEPAKGYKFSTYAYWWIRQGITRAIAQQARTIRIPIHITEKLNKIKRTQRELSQSLGRTPTLAEVAETLEISVEDIKSSLAISRTPLSLEMRVGDDQSSELGDMLEDDTHATLEENVTQQHLKQDLLNLLSSLSPAQKEVITLRFGLIDGHELTLAQVGDRLGVSRERVRQIQQSALKSLRLRKNGVNGYLDE